ncbi:hypothetical protein Tco_0894240 [Tanacetum coccineum]|uniref:Uncharacterized protein n=1 Tax=Tanacetum coccineum TaxID=301880 RepID=A0ABQ5CDV9_9ASTR
MAIIAISGRSTCCQYSSDTLVDHGLKLGTGGTKCGCRVGDGGGVGVAIWVYPRGPSSSVLAVSELDHLSLEALPLFFSAPTNCPLLVSRSDMPFGNVPDRKHSLDVRQRQRYPGLLLNQKGQCGYGIGPTPCTHVDWALSRARSYPCIIQLRIY